MTHLDEAERVVFRHKAFDATADLLETGLVLADPGDVLLNRRPVGVTVSTCAFSQSGDEAVHFGLHLLTQPGQALLRVVHKLLDEGRDEEEKRNNTGRHQDDSAFALGKVQYDQSIDRKQATILIN